MQYFVDGTADLGLVLGVGRMKMNFNVSIFCDKKNNNPFSEWR